MTDEEYFALEALSASGAKLLKKSPLHYRADRDRPRQPTPAMVFGTVVHTLALEPGKPAYSVKTLNWASREGRIERQKLESQGLPILTQADADRAEAIRDALHTDKRIAGYLTGATVETPLQWEQHGVKCKAKPDAVVDGIILDLKTCVDASPAGFARSVAQFSYHMQAAFYIDGYAATHKSGARDFIFIAVESAAPHAVGLYRLDDAALAAGRREMRRAAELYRDCMQTGNWPGYAWDVTTLSLPAWAASPDEWRDVA